MNERKEQLLNLLVENYIRTAEPIGSRFLLNASKLDIGEATVRNDLRSLEEEGFLTHPHTSAGRIPTEMGYRFYLEDLRMEKARLSKRENEVLARALSKKDQNYVQARKGMAKEMADVSDAAVMVAFSDDSVYYTGLAKLFSQPEFKETDLVASVSQVFDNCDECLGDFFEVVDENTKVYVGGENPFGERMSIIASKFEGEDQAGTVLVIGPIRQNYKKNFALINKIKEII
jgi:heat-inducible transcriptional repressor